MQANPGPTIHVGAITPSGNPALPNLKERLATQHITPASVPSTEVGPIQPQITTNPGGNGFDLNGALSGLWKGGTGLASALYGELQKHEAMREAGNGITPYQVQVRGQNIAQQNANTQQTATLGSLQNQKSGIELQRQLALQQIQANKALTDADRAEKAREANQSADIQQQEIDKNILMLQRGLTTSGQTAAGRYY